jgi:hypothetical protein|tara:strand:- start:41 stop:484 length:444 start_codon:yes stop_codon:yes gene_type:complete
MDIEVEIDGLAEALTKGLRCQNKGEMAMLKDTLEFDEALNLFMKIQDLVKDANATPMLGLAIYKGMFDYLERAFLFSEPKIDSAIGQNEVIKKELQKKYDQMNEAFRAARFHMARLQDSLDEDFNLSRIEKLKNGFRNWFEASSSQH